MISELILSSKWKYEDHFRKWNIRKKLTKAKWKDIIRFMRQRALFHDRVELLFDGVPLSQERIDRAIARYGLASECSDVTLEGRWMPATLSKFADLGKSITAFPKKSKPARRWASGYPPSRIIFE
jgi:hypothetical protein